MPPARIGGTGLAGGFFSGLTGVGGGALMVPLFTGVLKLTQHRAHGTSLLVVFFVGISGTATYWISQGSLPWHLVAGLCLGSLAGAYFGARWMLRVPAMTLRSIFALMLLVVAIRLVVFTHLGALAHPEGLAEWSIAAAVGLVGGVLAGMLGIGGGAVFVPAMVLLLGVAQHDAQGASLAVIVLTAAVGSFAHYRNETIDMEVVRWIIPFAVPASIGGAALANFLADDVLQRVFGVTVLLVSLQMLYSSIRAARTGYGWGPLRRLTRVSLAEPRVDGET